MNQGQPGTQGAIPTINAQGNASRTMSTEYSQLGSTLGNIDAKKARAQGEALAKEILAGLKDTLSQFSDLTAFLNSSTEKLKHFRDEMELSGEAARELNGYINKLDKVQKDMINNQAALTEESNKQNPNYKRILGLESERIQLQEKAERLTSNITKERELAEIIQKREIVLKEKELGYEEEAEKLTNDILEKRIEIATTNEKISKQYGDQNELLEKAGKALDKQNKTLKERVKSFQDGLGTITSGINNILNHTNISDQIDLWSSEIDKFTETTYRMGNVFGSDYGKQFNSLKNQLIDELNSDGTVFSSTQIDNAMKDLSQFSFDSYDTLKGMSKDLTYAKEYMGMQNDTLTEMYGLQLRTGDDTFVKKQLATVVSLQKSGLQVSEDTLNQMAKSSMSLTETLIGMGMSYEDAAEFNSQLLEKMAIADKIYGPGGGEMLKNQIESVVKGGVEGMSELGPTAINGLMDSLNGGGFDSLMNGIMNSETANVYDKLYSQGPSPATIMMGSGEFSMGGLDPAFFRNYKQNEGKLNEAIEESSENTKDLSEVDKRIAEIAERYPDDLKQNNAMMAELMKTDFDVISRQEAMQQRFEKIMTRANSGIETVIGVLSMVTMAMNTLTASLNANSASSTIGNALGGTGSFKGNMKQLFSKNGLKAVGKSLGTTAIQAGGIYAASTMISDGLSVGSSGFKDSEGNRIEGTGGFGDGLAGAFAGSEVKDSAAGNIGGGALGGAAKGAAIGAALGTVVPVLGNGVGLVVGGIVGGLGGLLGGIRKDNARKAEEQKKLMEHQIELAGETASNSKELKGLRDAVLVDRYSDFREGPAVGGLGGPTSIHSETHSPRKVAARGGDSTHPGEQPGFRGGYKDKSQSESDAKWGDTMYKNVPLNPFVFTSHYGYRKNPFGPDIKWHSGVDISKGGSYDQPIGAAFDGTVVDMYNENRAKDGGKANYVAVYHEGQGVTGLYYHLSSALEGLKVGDTVRAGNVIGYQGSTGQSTGPHLHYQVNHGQGVKWGQDIDPGDYITSGIFNTNGPVIGIKGDEDDEDYDGIRNRDASAVMPTATPGIAVGGPEERTSQNTAQEFRSSSIEGKLDTLNKTLLGMQAKQDKQDEILKALTNTPIYNYGI